MEGGQMATNLTRLRSIFGLGKRSAAACPDVLMDGERTDRELALLAKAEREFRVEEWQRRSILGGGK
jgi:hypothetical protein